MSRSQGPSTPVAALLATLAGCNFSTFGVDIADGDASGDATHGPPIATTAVEPTTTTAITTTTGEPADTTTALATTGDPTTDAPTSSTTTTADETTGGPPVCAPPTPISLEQTLAAIADDLEATDPTALPFTRYLGLVHLHNAGLCDEAIEPRRHALAKLVNSLSLAPGVAPPAYVDAARLLVRVDVRALGWDRKATSTALVQSFPDVWELLAASDPYAVAYAGATAADLQAATGTDYPLLRADAVLRHAVAAPLYYDVIGVPLTRATLEATLGLDTAGGLAKERSGEIVGEVARAALHSSDVAAAHRVVQRHTFAKVQGAYWIAHDFLELTPDTDVFSAPFDFQADELSVAFNLPNGLQGFALFDPEGTRRDAAVPKLLVDPKLPDAPVRAGISCIGCHTAGIQAAEDDLRWALDAGESEVDFDGPTQDQIRRVYPPRAELGQQIAADKQRFAAALASADVPHDLPEEPVFAAYLEYDAPIDLRRAAGELWLADLAEDDLLAAIAGLDDALHPLADDATVSREVFTANFAAAICALDLGRTAACP